MKCRSWTVVFAPTGGGTVRKYRISRTLVFALLVPAFLLVLSFALTGLQYSSMSRHVDHYDGLLAEIDYLRRENASFRVSARQLNDQIRLIDTATRKLEIMAGFAEDGAGVGGPDDTQSPFSSLEDPLNLKHHFNALEGQRIALDQQLNRLQDYFISLQVLMDAAPSLMPVKGQPGDGLGMRRDPITGQRRYHRGLDISAPRGTSVVAAAKGRVSFAGRRAGYGKLVVVEHRFGIQSYYAHLSKITVKPGQDVDKRDVIGYVGQTGRATGDHVHYEVRIQGEALDPYFFFREL